MKRISFRLYPLAFFQFAAIVGVLIFVALPTPRANDYERSPSCITEELDGDGDDPIKCCASFELLDSLSSIGGTDFQRVLAVGELGTSEFAVLLDVTPPKTRDTYLVGRFTLSKNGRITIKQTSTFTLDDSILWAEWSDFGVFYTYMNGPLQIDLDGRVEDLKKAFGAGKTGDVVLAMVTSTKGDRYILRGPDRSDGASAVSFEVQYSDSTGTKGKRLTVGPVTLANGHTSDLARGRLLCTSDRLYVFLPGGKVFVTDFTLSYVKAVVEDAAWKWISTQDLHQVYWYFGIASRSSVLCGYGSGAWLLSDDGARTQCVASAALRSPVSRGSFLSNSSSVIVMFGQGETTAPFAISVLDFTQDVTFQTPIPIEIVAKIGEGASPIGVLPFDSNSVILVFTTGRILQSSIQLGALGLGKK